MSDAEIEQFLREAEVVQVEDLDTGITKPQRLTLRLGDRELRAVYKNYDSDPDFSPSRWSTRRGNLADRYVYDVAAYHLDRILGLEMVPPAVIREVDGREGVVQYWLENAINERGRRQQEIPYRGQCSLANQYSLMNLFDALIHNDDRNLTNVLYTRGDWKLWLIDHSRAFRSHSRLPEFREDAPFRFTPRIRALLASIDAERLAPLRAYLHKRQIDGIVRRAERLARAGQ